MERDAHIWLKDHTEPFRKVAAEDSASELIAAAAGVNIHSLERYQPAPNRIKQKVDLFSVQSFCNYINRFKDEESTIYLNIVAGMFGARLDHHGKNDPAWGDHVAFFQPKQSIEWCAWNRVNGATLNQLELAEFIEENLDAFIEPEANVMLKAALEFEANEKLALGSSMNLDDGTSRFTFIKDNAKKDVTFPHRVRISIPIFENEGVRELELRIRYKTTGEGALSFRIIFVERVAMILRDELLGIAADIRTRCDDLFQYEGKWMEDRR